MKLITNDNKAKTTAERWIKQFFDPHRNRWDFEEEGYHKARYEQLVALGENITPEDVARIIGNSSWASCTCDECGLSVESVILLGEYSEQYRICLNCLLEAVDQCRKVTISNA